MLSNKSVIFSYEMLQLIDCLISTEDTDGLVL